MNRYAVVRADLHRDAAAILGVWARNLRAQAAARKFEWYYRNNPCGEGRCWLLTAEPGGEVVGVAGLGLRRLCVGGREMLVGVGSDLAVDQLHRSLLPALMLQKAVLASLSPQMPLIYTMPSTRSLAVSCRAGFREVAPLARHIKILRFKPYLSSYLSVPGAAGAIDLAMRIASPETWRRSHGRVGRDLTGFDERFDALWRCAASAFPMTVVRGSDYLRWRYTDCPLQSYGIFALFSRDESHLLGYIVYYLNPNGMAAIVDFLARPEEGLAEDLLAAFIRRCRGRGDTAIVCETLGAGALGSVLSQFGFLRRNPTVRLVAFPLAQGRVLPLRNWYFLRGDEDYN